MIDDGNDTGKTSPSDRIISNYIEKTLEKKGVYRLSFEEGSDMVVKADIPGIGKDDLNVSITENTLTISGEKKQEEKVEKKDFHRFERSYGSFSRSFRLPDNVNGEKAKANFTDGVLEVRIPKTKESKVKKISIS